MCAVAKEAERARARRLRRADDFASMVRNSLREAVAEYDGQLVPRAGEEDFYGTENAMFLLLILYLAFIGLGLPDPLLGAAWPILHEDLGAPLAAEGLIYIIISGGTVISAAQTARVLRCRGVSCTRNVPNY